MRCRKSKNRQILINLLPYVLRIGQDRVQGTKRFSSSSSAKERHAAAFRAKNTRLDNLTMFISNMNVRAQTRNISLIIDFVWLIRAGMCFPPKYLVKYGLVSRYWPGTSLVSRYGCTACCVGSGGDVASVCAATCRTGSTTTTTTRSGDDSCRYANDNACDEPTYCRASTDATDCAS